MKVDSKTRERDYIFGSAFFPFWFYVSWFLDYVTAVLSQHSMQGYRRFDFLQMIYICTHVDNKRCSCTNNRQNLQISWERWERIRREIQELLFPAEEMKNRSTFRLDLLSASCVLDKWHGRLLDHSSSRSTVLWQQNYIFHVNDGPNREHVHY